MSVGAAAWQFSQPASSTSARVQLASGPGGVSGPTVPSLLAVDHVRLALGRYPPNPPPQQQLEGSTLLHMRRCPAFGRLPTLPACLPTGRAPQPRFTPSSLAVHATPHAAFTPQRAGGVLGATQAHGSGMAQLQAALDGERRGQPKQRSGSLHGAPQRGNRLPLSQPLRVGWGICPGSGWQPCSMPAAVPEQMCFVGLQHRMPRTQPAHLPLPPTAELEAAARDSMLAQCHALLSLEDTGVRRCCACATCGVHTVCLLGGELGCCACMCAVGHCVPRCACPPACPPDPALCCPLPCADCLPHDPLFDMLPASNTSQRCPPKREQVVAALQAAAAEAAALVNASGAGLGADSSLLAATVLPSLAPATCGRNKRSADVPAPATQLAAHAVRQPLKQQQAKQPPPVWGCAVPHLTPPAPAVAAGPAPPPLALAPAATPAAATPAPVTALAAGKRQRMLLLTAARGAAGTPGGSGATPGSGVGSNSRVQPKAQRRVARDLSFTPAPPLRQFSATGEAAGCVSVDSTCFCPRLHGRLGACLVQTGHVSCRDGRA